MVPLDIFELEPCGKEHEEGWWRGWKENIKEVSNRTVPRG